jgi:hypothetical protein
MEGDWGINADSPTEPTDFNIEIFIYVEKI